MDTVGAVLLAGWVVLGAMLGAMALWAYGRTLLKKLHRVLNLVRVYRQMARLEAEAGYRFARPTEKDSS